MNIAIRATTDVETPAVFLAASIIRQLESGKKVLWFATGGSSIAVVIEAAKIIGKQSHGGLCRNLHITLTDERYGPLGHADSNWQQMIDKGFNLPDAKLIHILTGRDIVETTKTFNAILRTELAEMTYKIGLFGIGADGHTAGILPGSGAIDSECLAYSYATPQFERITITLEVIDKLDEAVVFMQGKQKWHIIEDLQKDIKVSQQPAQILKVVPVLTIFTDYTSSRA